MADVGTVKYTVELDDSGVDKQISKTEGTITSKLGGAFKKTAAGLGLATLGVSAAVIGTGKAVFSMADDVSKAGDEIDKMSQKIGVSREAYQEWAYVFDRSGANINGLMVGMKTLSGVITNASNGSKEAAAKLDALGVSIEDLNGLSQEEQFSLIVSKLQEMGEGAERTAVASSLLGRSAVDMAAVLNMSAEETQALIDETHEYGMILSDEAVKSSADYQDSLTKLKGTMNGLKNGAIAALLPGLTDLVNGMSDVANGSREAGDVISEGIQNVSQNLTESIPEMVTKGGELVMGIVSGIAENLPQMIGSAASIINQLAGSLADNLPTILDSAGKLIIGLVEGIIAALPQLAEAAVKILGALAMYLLDKIATLLDAGAELIRQLKDKFTSIDWAQVGADIINGIKDGILGAASRLAEAAKSAGEAALNGAKKLLKIESPSKVFRDQVGKMIPAGMAEGIEDGENEVVNSMNRMLGDFTADINLPNLNDYAANLGASISAVSNSTINVPVILDGREIARASAWYTNEQLAWESR